MNAFDAGVLLWLNQFAHRAHAFDAGMKLLSGLYLVKGELFMAGLWWAWNEPRGGKERNRGIVLATLAAAFAAVVLGRLLAHFLPYRARPLLNPALGFVPPAPLAGDEAAREWSAFPSDHAMLFSALATGFWFLSRRVGAAAHAFWILLIAFPRVYLGLHYPTDILAGGLLGAGLSWGANAERVRGALDATVRPWREARPGVFHALLFLAAFQVATMFDEPRGLLRKVGRWRAARAAAGAAVRP